MSDKEKEPLLKLVEVVKTLNTRLHEVALEVIDLKDEVAWLKEKLIAAQNEKP